MNMNLMKSFLEAVKGDVYESDTHWSLSSMRYVFRNSADEFDAVMMFCVMNEIVTYGPQPHYTSNVFTPGPNFDKAMSLVEEICLPS